MSVANAKLVQVCDRCHRASCWYGEFLCDDAVIAGTVLMPVGKLRKLGAENASYWTAEAFKRIYGTSEPDFTGVPPRRASGASLLGSGAA